MRLASFRRNDREGFGAVTDDVLIDLSGTHGFASLHDAMAHAALPALQQASSQRRGHIPIADVQLLPPLAGRGRSFWVGANYLTLISNRDGSRPSGPYPSLFMRTDQSIVGHGSALVRPRVSDQLDYEGEIVIVIGKGGRHIREADALAHIGGFTIANDGSVRDYMDHSRNVTAGKNFDASASIGPWLVTRDEIDPAASLSLETRVNGELRQRSSTDELRFSFAQLIAYISSFATLMPGDMISTGSPMGAGGGPFGADPPRWLAAGDVIEITVPGIGQLRNHVVDDSNVSE